jgi:hypothetical protein
MSGANPNHAPPFALKALQMMVAETHLQTG